MSCQAGSRPSCTHIAQFNNSLSQPFSILPKPRLVEFLPFFESQFASVGPGCVGGERDTSGSGSGRGGDPFFQETPDTFTMWASGRRHVQGGMAVSLQLRPRHDGIRKMWEFLLPTEVRIWAGLAHTRTHTPNKNPNPSSTNQTKPNPHFNLRTRWCWRRAWSRARPRR